MNRKSGKNMDGVDGKGRSGLRIIPAIIAIATVMSACGGSKSNYSEMAAGAPAAVAEEIAYEDAAYDGGMVLNESARSASYGYETAEAAAEEPVGILLAAGRIRRRRPRPRAS